MGTTYYYAAVALLVDHDITQINVTHPTNGVNHCSIFSVV